MSDQSAPILSAAKQSYQGGQTREAIQMLRTYLKAQPGDLSAWLLLADFYPLSRSKLKIYQKASQLAPQDRSLRRALSGCLMEMNLSANAAEAQDDNEAAAETRRMILDIFPMDTRALKAHLPYLAKQKLTEELNTRLDAVLRDEIKSPLLLKLCEPYVSPQNEALLTRFYRLKALQSEDPEEVATLFGSLVFREAYADIALLITDIETRFPQEEQLKLRIARFYEEVGDSHKAYAIYEQNYKQSKKSDFGRIADYRLNAMQIELSSAERASIFLAVREAFGMSLIFVLMAFLDMHLNLQQAQARHLIGIIIALIGSYIVVTAASSPQQVPIAKWLGGVMPAKDKHKGWNTEDLLIIPWDSRIVLGLIGLTILILALVLVFAPSIHNLLMPVTPSVQWYEALDGLGF